MAASTDTYLTILENIDSIRHHLAMEIMFPLSYQSMLSLPNAVMYAEEILKLPITGNMGSLRENFPAHYYSRSCADYHKGHHCDNLKIRDGYEKEKTQPHSSVETLVDQNFFYMAAYVGNFDFIDKFMSQGKHRNVMAIKNAIHGLVAYLNTRRPVLSPETIEMLQNKIWSLFRKISPAITENMADHPQSYIWFQIVPDDDNEILANVISFKDYEHVLASPLTHEFLEYLLDLRQARILFLEPTCHRLNLEWLLEQPNFNIGRYHVTNIARSGRLLLVKGWEAKNDRLFPWTDELLDEFVNFTMIGIKGDMDAVIYAIAHGFTNQRLLIARALEKYSVTVFDVAAGMGGRLSYFETEALKRMPILKSYYDHYNYPVEDD